LLSGDGPAEAGHYDQERRCRDEPPEQDPLNPLNLVNP